MSRLAQLTACEIKLVYDTATDTARQVDEAKYPGARNYGPCAWSEIPVTLDLVWDVPAFDGVVVRDLKTGKKDYAHREQLLVQALAASRFYGRKKARIGFLWGRKTKCEADSLEMLDEAALEEASWEFAAVMAGIPVARPLTGQHCFFCPGRSVCPAHASPTEQEREEAFT